MYSDQFYRSVVADAPIATTVHRDGKMVYLNPVGMNLFGVTNLSEALGKPLLNFVHPDSQPYLVEKMQQFKVDIPSLTTLTLKMVSSDGHVIDVEVTGRPTYYQGQPATLVILLDISGRMKLETALQDSLEREKARTTELKTIIDSVPAIVWFSRDPECKQMISNQFGYNFLSYPPRTVVAPDLGATFICGG